MTDPVLERYRRLLIARTGKTLPEFDENAVHTAKTLAVLDTPGKSGAEQTRVCSINNPDPTAKRTKRIIEAVELPPEEILLWNFYAAFEKNRSERIFWAKQLEDLIALLPDLSVVICFGDEAWRGIRDVKLPTNVFLVGAPHPSNRSCNRDRTAEEQIHRSWRQVKTRLG